MHLVVHYVTSLPEIHGVYNFIVAVFFVAVDEIIHFAVSLILGYGSH